MIRPTCIVPDCDRPAALRDRCRHHYDQVLRITGSASLADWNTLAPPVRVTAASLERSRAKGQERAQEARERSKGASGPVVPAWNALQSDGTCPRQEACGEAVAQFGTAWACRGCPLVAGACLTPGCGKPVKARGACSACYQATLDSPERAARKGVCLTGRKNRLPSEPVPPCEVAGCDRPCKGTRLCDAHYQRALYLSRTRGGTPGEWVDEVIAVGAPVGRRGVSTVPKGARRSGGVLPEIPAGEAA